MFFYKIALYKKRFFKKFLTQWEQKYVKHSYLTTGQGKILLCKRLLLRFLPKK